MNFLQKRKIAFVRISMCATYVDFVHYLNYPLPKKPLKGVKMIVKWFSDHHRSISGILMLYRSVIFIQKRRDMINEGHEIVTRAVQRENSACLMKGA